MLILACIPVLPTADDPAAWSAGTPPVARDRDADRADDRPPGLAVPASETVATSAPPDPQVEGEERVPAEPVPPVSCGNAPSRTVEWTRSSWLPAPSILVLAILAVAMWGAALRNDRLRLDAARQARAELMAQVVPDAGSPRGSRTR